MSQPENQPQQPAKWDVDVITTDVEDEASHPWVLLMEQYVKSTFHEWIKKGGLHESRVDDIINQSPDKLLSKFQGNERDRVLRYANIALREYDVPKQPELPFES